MAMTIPMIPTPIDDCCETGSIDAISAEEADAYAQALRALADPTRIRMLSLLARRQEAVCVCEFVDWLPLGQSTISHHLKILRDARFVTTERRGTFMYYQLNPSSTAILPTAIQRTLNLREG